MKRLLLIAAALTAALTAQAETFPGTKPITIIVPFAAGGPTDRVARDLAVLADEHERVAVDGAVVVDIDEKRRRFRLVLALSRHPRARVTPCAAQQGGVRRGGQCQHNRKKGCPKHGCYSR